jgi:hypothetical protein
MMAPTSETLNNNGQTTETDVLNLHKDDLSAQSLDLKDNHGKHALGVFGEACPYDLVNSC